MKFKSYLPLIATALLLFSACKKEPVNGILNYDNFSDTSSATLKDAASKDGFAFGTTLSYSDLVSNPGIILSTAVKDFSYTTFGYEMKHGAICKDNGTLNYANADAMVAKCNTVGLPIYGHTLGWHQNQNATYLKNYAGITIPAATELVSNPGFESGSSSWSVFNTNGATISFVTGDAANAHAATGYMKVVNPTANSGNQWKVQVSSASFATVPGKQYTISYYVKAASAGGSIRLSTGPTGAQYQGDQNIGTSWQQVSWTITATLSSTTFLFDMGQAANTYYIDDASVKEVVVVASGTTIALKLDSALNNFITTSVAHFKGTVKVWDVINELFADDGNLRNNTNTSTTASDVLVWSNYLGRDYAYKAFKYAEAADPNAVLFINDYNLENGNSSAKLDSLISMVNELKTRGCKIDGIGTQLHVSWNSSYAGIDAMFKKLAATGLKIRISELDIRVNPSKVASYVLTPQSYAYQADIARYIIRSYLTNIPIAQRYICTYWGVSDSESWLLSATNAYPEAPNMWDINCVKKPAYSGVLQALQGK